jgi:hypothetical protein
MFEGYKLQNEQNNGLQNRLLRRASMAWHVDIRRYSINPR